MQLGSHLQQAICAHTSTILLVCGIYDPGTSTVTESSGIFQKQCICHLEYRVELWWGLLATCGTQLLNIFKACTAPPWKMPKCYHVLLGWRLKGIQETLGVLIYDRQLALCVSTPIKSLMPEQDLSPRVLVPSKSNLLPF
jgi:hypothetical protein